MYKNIHSGIKIYNLDSTLYSLHKEGVEKSDFGMDNTRELIDNRFGLYSSKDLKKRIGPVKTEYFRIGLIRAGRVNFEIGNEIKNRKPDTSRAIQLYIDMIILHAGRCYDVEATEKHESVHSGKELFNSFIRLVSRHFLTMHKVADYANLLAVSADHLNRTIKNHSGKTAHELIDEMILLEARACLKYTNLSIAEIAYQLEFSDPSHFNKFFKKLSGFTPQGFGTKSE